MQPRGDPAALRHRRQVRRFQSVYGDLLGTMDDSLSQHDTERVLAQVEGRIDSAPDSVDGLREWALTETIRLSNLTAVVINNFPPCPDWLLERLCEYQGAADDSEFLSRWLSLETDHHEQCKKANEELCKSLFLDDRCTYAVRAGIKSILKASGGLGVNDALAEIENRTWLWVLSHGQELLNAPSDASWPGRLYKLAAAQAHGWKTSRIRDRKRLHSIEPILAGVSRAGIPVDGRQVTPRPSASWHDELSQGSRLADRLQYGA